jgi:hypothetical protein
MSTPTQTPPPPAGDPVSATCPRCGAPLRPEQDWCLNCGAAVTTEVAGAPAWRAPIAIVGAVLVVAAIALVIAFIKLSGDSQQIAQAPAPTPVATAAPVVPAPTPVPGVVATATPEATLPAVPGASATPVPTPDSTVDPGSTTTPVTGSFADWPAGKTAYTVIMWSATTRSEAEAKAKTFQAAGSTVGILHSNDFSSLRSGYWVVFSGQYDALSAAQAAAAAAQATAPGAYAKQVKPK